MPMWREQLIFYKESPFQRIAFFTEKDGSYSLTLDDYWQFNTNCEHIYHECLFTMPGIFPDKLENVLVLGGGDGLGARELLKYKTVTNIDLVDLDPEIIKFAKTNVIMRHLNKDSFNNGKVNINVTDAKKWLAATNPKPYDLVIVDFPDPTTDLLWDLYTVKLYKQVYDRLAPHGVVAIQSSTYNTRTFELIYDRLEKVFPYIIGYHTGASSVFCGFFLASKKPIKAKRPIPKGCKWINPKLINLLLGVPVLATRENKQVNQVVSNVLVKKKMSGLGNFGKGAIAPAPAPPPASDGTTMIQAVGHDIAMVGGSAPTDPLIPQSREHVDVRVEGANAPPEFYFDENEPIIARPKGGLPVSPVVIGGGLLAAAIPLIIKLIL